MGLRMTNQRELILRELRGSRAHLTADQLYDRVRKTMPRISLATVYRNLETLAAAGMIGKIQTGGRQKHFDYDASVHHHIHCLRCHRIDNIELPGSGVDYFDFAGGSDPKPETMRVDFFGICPRCRNQPRQQETRQR